MMNTIKHILLIFFLGCSTLLLATDFTLYETSSAKLSEHRRSGWQNHQVSPTNVASPTMHFHSTSSITFSGSSLPSAAETGFISADAQLYDNGSTPSNSGNAPAGRRRVGPDGGYGDPGAEPDTPIGNIPWICLLLLAAAYGIYLKRKNSIRTPESRHK